MSHTHHMEAELILFVYDWPAYDDYCNWAILKDDRGKQHVLSPSDAGLSHEWGHVWYDYSLCDLTRRETPHGWTVKCKMLDARSAIGTAAPAVDDFYATPPQNIMFKTKEQMIDTLRRYEVTQLPSLKLYAGGYVVDVPLNREQTIQPFQTKPSIGACRLFIKNFVDDTLEKILKVTEQNAAGAAADLP